MLVYLTLTTPAELCRCGSVSYLLRQRSICSSPFVFSLLIDFHVLLNDFACIVNQMSSALSTGALSEYEQAKSEERERVGRGLGQARADRTSAALITSVLLCRKRERVTLPLVEGMPYPILLSDRAREDYHDSVSQMSFPSLLLLFPLHFLV